MTVRELVNELTEHYVDWDKEVVVCITDKPVKSGDRVEYTKYKINHFELYTPIWYVNDRCILLLNMEEK